LFLDISSDTRQLATGALFIALRGKRFDGHEFLAQAAAAGCTGLLIDEQAAPLAENHIRAGLSVICVPDTLAALQAIAAGYRQTLSAPVIAITGSVGKTSTRSLVAACLSGLGSICQTEANNNNEIGLPRTILSANQQDQAIVLEMGMRGRGEIELLSEIANPDIAIITNIGLSHIERLGSQVEILRAKAEILTGLKPDGWLVLNADDPHLRNLAKSLAGRFRLAAVSLAAEGPDGLAADLSVTAGQIVPGPDGTQMAVRFRTAASDQTVQSRLPVPGLHMASNALFGLAVACLLGLDPASAVAALADCQGPGGRQHLIQAGSVLVMDDTYNASPESMKASLTTLSSIADGRRLVAALGGMLELGDHAPAAHRDVGEAAARAGFDWLLALGPQASDMAVGFAQAAPACPVATFSEQTALIEALLSGLGPGDAVLVKGSRGFAMETVTAAIVAAFANPEGQEPCN
jgi:UDP-N-acetylmuramoyl-tripeptide--D-alanyl-D-alanine ligase